MPSCPMAMPSSMAMVLNSAAKQPSASIRCLTYCPISCRCTCPGTSWVNELAMPMTGRPNCSSRMPLARHRLLAPAMRRPVVVTALLSGCFIFFLFSAYCAFAICPDNKNLSPSGERPFIIFRIYTSPFSRYLAKDDEQQINDVIIRMVLGVHVRNLRVCSVSKIGI